MTEYVKEERPKAENRVLKEICVSKGTEVIGDRRKFHNYKLSDGTLRQILLG